MSTTSTDRDLIDRLRTMLKTRERFHDDVRTRHGIEALLRFYDARSHDIVGGVVVEARVRGFGDDEIVVRTPDGTRYTVGTTFSHEGSGLEAKPLAEGLVPCTKKCFMPNCEKTCCLPAGHDGCHSCSS